MDRKIVQDAHSKINEVSSTIISAVVVEETEEQFSSEFNIKFESTAMLTQLMSKVIAKAGSELGKAMAEETGVKADDVSLIVAGIGTLLSGIRHELKENMHVDFFELAMEVDDED